jgi:predicted outer membrane lipoprotein
MPRLWFILQMAFNVLVALWMLEMTRERRKQRKRHGAGLDSMDVPPPVPSTGTGPPADYDG